MAGLTDVAGGKARFDDGSEVALPPGAAVGPARSGGWRVSYQPAGADAPVAFTAPPGMDAGDFGKCLRAITTEANRDAHD